MLIMKFGGRTLENAQRINLVGRIIQQRLRQKPVVIISALAGVTDQLEKQAYSTVKTGQINLSPIHQKHNIILKQLGLPNNLVAGLFDELEVVFKGVSLLRELTPRTLDYILSFGERWATRIVAAYLCKIGIPARALDAYHIGLRTDSNFGCAHPLAGCAPRLRQNITRIKEVPVITGFIGKDKKGEITTLGRDGSDYTASFIGASLGVREVQIWRDLAGVMSADPNLIGIKSARVIKQITITEASELVYYGNGVLHPYMLIPAVAKGIPVRMMNIFEPNSTGTVISQKAITHPPVKAIAYKKGVTLVEFTSPEVFHHRRLANEVFAILNHHNIFYHLVTSSEITVAFATEEGRAGLSEAINEISSLGRVNISKHQAIVALVGAGLKDHPEIPGQILGELARQRIRYTTASLAPSRTIFTFVIPEKLVKKVVNLIHRAIYA